MKTRFCRLPPVLVDEAGGKLADLCHVGCAASWLMSTCWHDRPHLQSVEDQHCSCSAVVQDSTELCEFLNESMVSRKPADALL